MNALIDRPAFETRLEVRDCCPWCDRPQVLCTKSSCDEELETYRGVKVGDRWIRLEEFEAA